MFNRWLLTTTTATVLAFSALSAKAETPGRQFLSHAYEILKKVDEAMHLNVVSSEIEGTLTVAATYTVIGYFLPLHIERLRRLFPRLEIQLFELNRESIEEGLLSNRYDMSVLLTSNILNPVGRGSARRWHGSPGRSWRYHDARARSPPRNARRRRAGSRA